VTVRIVDELSNRFAFHPATDDATRDAHEEVREAAYAFAAVIERVTPPGRDQSLAFTKIEEAMMWGNKAIACARGLEQLERGDSHGDTDR
jgi:hypothetical protein